MNKFKYLNVDDNSDSLDVIRGHMMKYSKKYECVGEAKTGLQAIELIQAKKPDLIFLDIELPDMHAFDVLKAFRNPNFEIIFVTCFSDYAVNAIKYSAIDYLLKPFKASQMIDALKRFERYKTKPEESRIRNLKRSLDNQLFDRLILPLTKSYQVLKLAEIISLEAKRGNYVLFYMENGQQYLATHPLNYYEDLLSDTHFYRVHKSHMININKVDKVDNGAGGNVHMSTGAALPVAFRRKSELMKILRDRATPLEE